MNTVEKNSRHGSPESGHGTGFFFVLLFAVMAAGIVTFGYRYYRNYEQNYYEETGRELSAITDLKVDELVQYRKERLGDASIFYENSAFSERVRDFLEQPADADARRQLQAWLGRFQSYYEYTRISLFDVQGAERLVVPDRPEPLPGHLANDIAAVLKSRQVTFLDFHRDAPGLPIQLEILVPIYDSPATNRPLGVLVLRINPETRLYPFIKRWPMPSATGETLLVRREGNEVVFLNELLFRTNTALNLRIPLTNTNVLAVKAALGETGIVEGQDYRGALVIGDVRAVPGSPWFLVAREDAGEIFAPMRARLWQMIFTLGVLLLAAGAGVGLLWRQQRVQFFREKLEAQAERARLGAIVESSHDAIVGGNLDGIISSWNIGAEKIYGYGAAEAIGQSVVMLIPHGKNEEFARLLEDVKRGESVINHDTDRIRKDGERIHVSLTLSPVRDAAGKVVGVSAIGCDITEQKRAEAALRRSREEFKDLFDNAPVGFHELDAEGRLTRVNNMELQILGYTAGELLGQFVWKLSATEELSRRATFAKLGGEPPPPQGFERTLRRKDGSTVPVLIHDRILRRADGAIIGIHSTIEDITVRKQAEKFLAERTAELAKERLFLRTLIDNLPDAIYAKDIEARKILTNPADLKNLGFKIEDEAVGKTDFDVFPKEIADAFFADDQSVLKEGKPVINREEKIVMPDGVTRWLLTSKIPWRDASGKIVGLVGIGHDITDRKRAGQALEHERKLLRTLIDNIPDSIYVRDLSNRFVVANASFARLMGVTGPSDLIGKKDADFYPPELAVNFDKIDQEVLAGRQILNRERVIRFPNGQELAMLNTKVPFKNDKGEVVGLIGVGHDITERKAAEARLQNTMADLERSNKELEQFAYIASHDLQEPLRMVSSYTQLLAKRFEGQLDEKTRKYVHYAVDGATRMQSLINDLLAYSRVGRQGKPIEPADAHAILGEAVRNLAARIEETHAVITNDDLPTVRVDASQLVLVFQNLLANAIKFRREGIPGIHVSAQDKGGEWLFAVKDNGIGIEARHAERVFVIFQRLHTREEYPGTGIGLSVCKRIVERHGGKIWFESEPGNGTTFFFTIPK
jgi:PAS domain S-box-containing protein